MWSRFGSSAARSQQQADVLLGDISKEPGREERDPEKRRRSLVWIRSPPGHAGEAESEKPDQ